MSKHCPGGCSDTEFAREKDLWQHLRTSTNPKCRQAAESLASSIRRPIRHDRPVDVSHTPSSPVAGSSGAVPNNPPATSVHDHPIPPVRFEGDYFGDDYQDEDFPFVPSRADLAPQVPSGADAPLLRVTEVDDDEPSDDEEDVVGHDIVDPEARLSPSQRRSPILHPTPPGGAVLDLPIDAEPPQAANNTGDPAEDGLENPARPELQEQLREAPVYVQQFGGKAGDTIIDPASKTSTYGEYGSQVGAGATNNPYAPFTSRLDWEVAQWAKERGVSATAITELLKIQGLVSALGLSYKNATELNTIINEKLPRRRPAFTHHYVTVMGEKFDLFARDIIECIRALYGDPEHVQYLCFAPERHYADADKTVRLYHDLHTGRWWWDTQSAVEENTPGATIIPLILSSDKTQVTLFRNKSAYPVYLTIGNLPKSIRRKPSRHGQILLAYLPTTRLEHITNKAARRRTLTNLFHACMSFLLKPLEDASADGVPMMSGDGVWRRCHPILAVYVGDYPEQCLVTGSYTGDCPVCNCRHDELEIYPGEHEDRNLASVLKALQSIGSPSFANTCREANVKPVQNPFWEGLSYVNIFSSITPDILHQLHQGVFKHLLSWLKDVCGAEEIDARVSRLPPNHSVRIFWKGITKLSRVSGTEHKQMSRFLLGIIIDMPLPGGRAVTERLLRAARGLLDFLYMAQYPVHTDHTLNALENALATFHANRDVFVTLGARSAFNIPKLHFLLHYVRFIMLFGTTDNYNTEATERLHIDFAKDAYRATNHKDEYPQMTQWLERREKIAHHANYIIWRLQQVEVGPATLSANHHVRWAPPDLACTLAIKMTKYPTKKAVRLNDVISPAQYGATFFIAALARFVVQWTNPAWTRRQVEDHARYVRIPFATIPVFHRVKFWNEAVYGNDTVDSLHVHPGRLHDDDGELVVPARFDTVLIRVDRGLGEPMEEAGDMGERLVLADMQVAQARVIFSLPETALAQLFPTLAPERLPPRHLAYVEWFSAFPAVPERHSGLYKVTRLENPGGGRVASIVPVAYMQRTVHLVPKWGGEVNRAWSSGNVLDECNAFYVNTFKDPHSYFNLY